jgi:2-dehydropantoate 2-reductase
MSDSGVDHIVVLGAGAIGSLYAAKLAARHDVTVIGRPSHVAAIERDGLRVIGRETFTSRLHALASMPPLAARTIVLLTTKVNDNQTAAEALADSVREDTVVLCVQNGLHGEAIVKAVLGARCLVLRGITQCGAIFREPGVVDFRIAGETYVEASPRSAVIAALLTASGLDGRVCEAIAVEVWRKLIFNCVINPITSITGGEVGSIADARLDPIKQLVIDECLRVARADGVTFEIDFIKALAEVFGPSRNTASMRQDLLKRKPTEIDHMNGAVVALGQCYGIDCPVNSALVTLIKALERSNLKSKV